MTSSGKKPLKILHIDPERNWGGGERQVLGLVTHLSQWGHRNHLLGDPGGLLFRACTKKGIESFPLRIRNDLDLRPVPGIRRLIRRENYQIVHLHTKRAHALSVWLPRSPDGPKYLVTRRMDYPEAANWYTRCLYNRRVDGVVAISKAIAELLFQAGVQRNRIQVIHSGIDLEPFQRARMNGIGHSQAVTIGTVAVLEERKGHRYLLEAAALLKSEGYRLKYHFAGEGSLRPALEEMVQRLRLQDDVVFLGFVSDVPSFLASIDIFVLPSLHEGLGVAALEAMAAEKAVVASRVGGLAEVVEDSVTGYLVPPGDASGLAAAIRTLTRDPSSAREMGARAARRVSENFTVEQMAMGNEKVYYSLLDAAGA